MLRLGFASLSLQHSSCYGRNERDVLPFRHFMNEELREAAAAKGFVEDALSEAVIHPEEVDVFDYGAWAAQRRLVRLGYLALSHAENSVSS